MPSLISIMLSARSIAASTVPSALSKELEASEMELVAFAAACDSARFAFDIPGMAMAVKFITPSCMVPARSDTCCSWFCTDCASWRS